MSRSQDVLQARTRVTRVQLSRSRGGWCSVEVGLSFPDGVEHEGTAGTHDTRPGLVRAGATAALEALQMGLGDASSVELRGAKTIRAFDAQLVIVSIRYRRGDLRSDLIGAVESPPGDLPRGGALAALDAVNRVLARDLSNADDPENS